MASQRDRCKVSVAGGFAKDAAILDAAARVFAQRGYTGTTTNHIADRAGVSVGSLYEYFPSKDAILVALTEAHLADVKRVLRNATRALAQAPEGVEGTIRRIVLAAVQAHALAPDLHRVLSEESLRSRRIRAIVAASEQKAVDWWVHYLGSQRELAVHDPSLAAAIVFQTIDTMVHKVVIHGGSAPIDRYVEEIVALVSGYLRSRRPAEA